MAARSHGGPEWRSKRAHSATETADTNETGEPAWRQAKRQKAADGSSRFVGRKVSGHGLEPQASSAAGAGAGAGAQKKIRWEHAEPCTILVGNIPWDAKPGDIREVFAAFGRVADVRVLHDRETGSSRGCAYVQFLTKDAASKALAGASSLRLAGNALRVQKAKTRVHAQREGDGRWPRYIRRALERGELTEADIEEMQPPGAAAKREPMSAPPHVGQAAGEAQASAPDAVGDALMSKSKARRLAVLEKRQTKLESLGMAQPDADATHAEPADAAAASGAGASEAAPRLARNAAPDESHLQRQLMVTNLPYEARSSDVATVFAGLCEPLAIVLVPGADGAPSGRAVIELESASLVRQAIARGGGRVLGRAVHLVPMSRRSLKRKKLRAAGVDPRSVPVVSNAAALAVPATQARKSAKEMHVEAAAKRIASSSLVPADWAAAGKVRRRQ